jgi:hypothetical protein
MFETETTSVVSRIPCVSFSKTITLVHIIQREKYNIIGVC